jgi:hypothetical protein
MVEGGRVTPSIVWLSESIALPALEQTVESVTSVISEDVTKGRWLLVRDIECSGIIMRLITRMKWSELVSAGRQRDCALMRPDIGSAESVIRNKKEKAVKTLAR